MALRIELTGYRRWRGDILGSVRVVADGAIVFADAVNLSRLKSRAEFSATLSERLNGNRPEGLDPEAELLRLLAKAEAELATETAPGAPAAADDEERVDDYVRRGGRFELVRVKETSAGPIETRLPLSNFEAQIIEDISVDDGAQLTRYFAISGTLDGRLMATVRVLAAEFAGLGWVAGAWGVGARVLPGLNRKDLLRDAIQAFSADARRRTVYGHLGWRLVEGRLLYLHGAGAIGATGAVDGSEVELEGKLALYSLPSPTDDGLNEAVRTSWDLWEVAPLGVSAPVGGVIYGAPLAEWLRSNFSLWLRGPTGRLKTTFAALALAHFGAFDDKTVPANFEATANHLEKEAFLIKDAPFLVDDYRPPSDRYEAGEMRRKAARLLRAAGNRAGRGRMRADTSLRPEYFPRGLVVVTAEEQAPGESTAARVWDVDFSEVTIDLSDLTQAQARTDLLRRAMAGYIRWLADRLQGGDDWLQQLSHEAADGRNTVGGHLRHPQTLAYLLTAWAVFAEFAQSVGAISAEEVVDRLREVAAALRQVAERQAEVAEAVRPDLVFVRTLGDLLAGGKAHLAKVDETPPADPRAWGWTERESVDDEGAATRSWCALGDKLGWVDDEYIYLIPSLAHRLVAKTVGERGEGFIVSPRALGESLERGGFLARGNKRRHHNKKVAGGRSQDTIRLRRRALDTAWGDAT
jgi:hypothetical protein